MSFKSRDLMANLLPARPFACGDATKQPDGGQCVDPTKPPQVRSEIAQRELGFEALRAQLRAALSLEQAARS